LYQSIKLAGRRESKSTSDASKPRNREVDDHKVNVMASERQSFELNKLSRNTKQTVLNQSMNSYTNLKDYSEMHSSYYHASNRKNKGTTNEMKVLRALKGFWMLLKLEMMAIKFMMLRTHCNFSLEHPICRDLLIWLLCR
jgi:hypothetical protein